MAQLEYEERAAKLSGSYVLLCGSGLRDTVGMRFCGDVAFRILSVIQVRTTLGWRPLSIYNYCSRTTMSIRRCWVRVHGSDAFERREALLRGENPPRRRACRSATALLRARYSAKTSMSIFQARSATSITIRFRPGTPQRGEEAVNRRWSVRRQSHAEAGVI